MKEPTNHPENRLVTAYLELTIRITLALVICGGTALAFMKFTGGSAMFCIYPALADPGWNWKVPLAWAIIYGVSTFVGVAVATFRAKTLMASIIVAFITMGAFITFRFINFSPSYPYFVQTEAHVGIPAMLVAGILACIVARMIRKTG